MKTAAVVIPIYKKSLEDDEALSLRQCFKILGNHPVIFVAPETLDLSNYKRICAEFLKDIFIERFEDRYFDNIHGYNKLMLSKPCVNCRNFFTHFQKKNSCHIHKVYYTTDRM